MKNTLKVNHESKTLIMDRTFAKFAEDTKSNEYEHLQQVRRDYPDYSVEVRKIKRNSQKETYKGLNYEYMEEYILRHETEENALDVIKEFNELRTISRCHKQGVRYPTIKKWFLEKYPEIEEFGMTA